MHKGPHAVLHGKASQILRSDERRGLHVLQDSHAGAVGDRQGSEYGDMFRQAGPRSQGTGSVKKATDDGENNMQLGTARASIILAQTLIPNASSRSQRDTTGRPHS